MKPWYPAAPSLTSGTLGGRSAETYLSVVRQFKVTSDPRYMPGKPTPSTTYCNIFASDVTRAMSAEIPHWWLAKELNANGMVEWLREKGLVYGWSLTTPVGATFNANQGCPTVATWHNPVGGPGHIAVVLPGPEGAPLIAQAGRRNFIGKPVEDGFGTLPVTYWRHD